MQKLKDYRECDKKDCTKKFIKKTIGAYKSLEKFLRVLNTSCLKLSKRTKQNKIRARAARPRQATGAPGQRQEPRPGVIEREVGYLQNWFGLGNPTKL